MVMEYVEGGDCATLLKNVGPLPLDLARFVCRFLNLYKQAFNDLHDTVAKYSITGSGDTVFASLCQYIRPLHPLLSH